MQIISHNSVKSARYPIAFKNNSITFSLVLAVKSKKKSNIIRPAYFSMGVTVQMNNQGKTKNVPNVFFENYLPTIFQYGGDSKGAIRYNQCASLTLSSSICLRKNPTCSKDNVLPIM